MKTSAQADMHLTDEQFTARLMGEDMSPAARAHLAGCAQCHAELDRFLSSVNSFGEAAMDWSKAQPAVSPRGTKTRTRETGWAWASAVAAVLVLAVSLPVLLHHEILEEDGRTAMASAAAVSASGDSVAQIAQDNTLLRAVNVAVNANDASPLDEYGLQDGPRKSTRRTGLSPE